MRLSCRDGPQTGTKTHFSCRINDRARWSSSWYHKISWLRNRQQEMPAYLPCPQFQFRRQPSESLLHRCHRHRYRRWLYQNTAWCWLQRSLSRLGCTCTRRQFLRFKSQWKTFRWESHQQKWHSETNRRSWACEWSLEPRTVQSAAILFLNLCTTKWYRSLHFLFLGLSKSRCTGLSRSCLLSASISVCLPVEGPQSSQEHFLKADPQHLSRQEIPYRTPDSV